MKISETIGNHTKGFKDFIMEQGVVGLAVGFVLGSASAGLVRAIVADIIDPLLGLLLGEADGLAEFVINIGKAELKVGHLLTVFIDFLIVALVIYFVLKVLHVDKLDKKKDKK